MAGLIPIGNIPAAADITTGAAIARPGSVSQRAVDDRIEGVAADIIAGNPTITAAAEAAVDAAVDAGALNSQWYPQWIKADPLILNGNFQSMTGWEVQGGTGTVAQSTVTVTADGTLGGPMLRRGAAARFLGHSGHKIYVRLMIRTLATDTVYLRFRLTDGATNVPLITEQMVPAPGHLTWYTISGIITLPASFEGKQVSPYIGAVWPSASAASGKQFQVAQLSLMDLTAAYGAGNEPTAEHMNPLIEALASSTLTATVPQLERDAVVATKKDLEELVLPGASASSRRHWSGQNTVVLRFDDGFKSNLTLAAPLMKLYGMVGYLAMCTGWVGTTQPAGLIMMPADVQRLRDEYRWEIGNHTNEHRDAIGHTAFLAGVDQASRDLVSWGLGYPDTFTYPNGSRTRATDREIYLRFRLAQLTASPEVSPAPFDQPTFFTGWAVVDGTAVGTTRQQQIDRMKTFVRESFRRGIQPILGFHEITVGPATLAWQLDFAAFAEIIQWLHDEGYPVGVPRDAPPHNMLGDAGFNEYPLLGWGTKGAHPWGVTPFSGGWQRVTTGQYSGLGAIRLATAAPTDSDVSQGIPVKGGEEYRIHVNARILARTAGMILVRVRPHTMFNDSVGPDLVPIEITAVTSGFEDFTALVTIPGGARSARVFIDAVGWHGDAIVDHVAIFPSWLDDPLAV